MEAIALLTNRAHSLSSCGSAAAAYLPGPGLAFLLSTHFRRAGSVSSLAPLLSSHPQAGLSDPGADPGKDTPLKNASDYLQGDLVINSV